jgi:hypothetical protein
MTLPGKIETNDVIGNAGQSFKRWLRADAICGSGLLDPIGSGASSAGDRHVVHTDAA